MPNFRHVIELAFDNILKRFPSEVEIDSYNSEINSGMSERKMREGLLRSAEYAERFPDGSTPPDPIPPGQQIISLTLADDKRCLRLNGKSYTIASHGNIVTAFPTHDWRGDLNLQIQNGESYARYWAFLAKDTVEWPWIKSGSRWDLSQFNPIFWDQLVEVVTECGKNGIILEPMIFDRCCGGGQQDYRNYPWHPDNNVNNVELPTNGAGNPEFYEAPNVSNLKALQELYVRKWVTTLKPFKNVILEIENEHRTGGGSAWARQWGRVIKSIDPERLVSYSSLEEDLEAAYFEPTIDIVNKHFGNDGDNPRTLHSYISTHWNKGKLINIDEFANGVTDPNLLREMCETITKNGAHFHIEDSAESAKGYDASAHCRTLISAANPPYCDVGPSGPAPPCPKEERRGLSMLYINRKGKRMFTGNAACEKASKEGKIKPGDNIVFDSTALVSTQYPVPEGCGNCVENPTVWSHTMGGRNKQDGPCGFEVWPEHSGTITARPKAGPGKAVTKSIKVVP